MSCPSCIQPKKLAAISEKAQLSALKRESKLKSVPRARIRSGSLNVCELNTQNCGIFASNAIIEPFAMMIKYFHTFVTQTTVSILSMTETQIVPLNTSIYAVIVDHVHILHANIAKYPILINLYIANWMLRFSRKEKDKNIKSQSRDKRTKDEIAFVSDGSHDVHLHTAAITMVAAIPYD
ncbi:unnamed protein product [Albugo candida]|uniref:Uncharacterized protein n=1 Tax=Albugo candida TaxID=65357 RepID=A0A024GIW9_9STRA|nr:unnamed protein product [Albugo candida]|eukprot:CCI46442.1 unnamed protein product [Albugo candida]